MLTRVQLKGFKSIREMDLELRRLNVLIGANGAGKSNLISFFKMLNAMTVSPYGGLQFFLADAGYAQSVLYFGPKRTPEMTATLTFEADGHVHTYHQRLAHIARDTLAFAEESLTSTSHAGNGQPPELLTLGAGHPESRLWTETRHLGKKGTAAGVVHRLLSRCRVYHFHDTSPTSRVRGHSFVEDNHWLASDGRNLAPFLLRLRERSFPAYRRILSTVRLVAPFIEDFVLQPQGTGPELMLNWRSAGSDEPFGPHQLSDGTLRAICLITLLLQPEDELPSSIVLDEPELGLHPYALHIVAGLLKKAAHHTQLIVSTQSALLLDEFEPENVVVVDRKDGGSQFTRPDPDVLDAWLAEYSLGEVWEKNVIGGGPH